MLSWGGCGDEQLQGAQALQRPWVEEDLWYRRISVFSNTLCFERHCAYSVHAGGVRARARVCVCTLMHLHTGVCPRTHLRRQGARMDIVHLITSLSILTSIR